MSYGFLFEKVFRRSPEGKEKDFVMDREQLLDESENLWQSIRREREEWWLDKYCAHIRY